jgi:hypothetical protein
MSSTISVIATRILGLTTPQLVVVALVVVLAPLVVYWVIRSFKQIAGSRRIYQAFAAQVGAEWSPPKNAQDMFNPGRVKGRYRGHKLTLDTTRVPHTRESALLPEAMIRVHFSRSLRLGLHGGGGTLRARNPGELTLSNARLRKLLRPKAKDEAGARALLDRPAVAEALLALGKRCSGVGIDDGTVSCAVGLPTSTAELQAAVDQVVVAAESIDAALEP